MSLFHTLSQLVFPHRCLGCRTTGAPICRTCLTSIPIQNTRTDTCRHLYPYKHPLVRKAIHQLKYYHNPHPARTLIAHARLHIQVHASQHTDTYVTAIPAREKPDRTYNHAAVLAQEIARHTSCQYRPLLRRTQHTKPQTACTYTERLHNQKHAFSVLPHTDLPPHVCIIDDVYTTGATYAAARSACLSAGISHVSGLTLAH